MFVRESNFIFQHSMFQATNHLMDELFKMQESLKGIRTKIKIADPLRTHPLLHLWKDDPVPPVQLQTVGIQEIMETVLGTKSPYRKDETRLASLSEEHDGERKSLDPTTFLRGLGYD